MFKLECADGWDIHFSKLDKSVQERIWKRILKLKVLSTSRHLKHGVPFLFLKLVNTGFAMKNLPLI